MEKLNLQGRALLAPAFLYFTDLLLRHKHHADHAGTDMGADGGAKLGHPAAGQLEILVHVVVHRCNKLLIIAVEQRIAVARVNTAERVQLLEHGDQRTGASAALVHELDLAVLQGQHRLDAERAARSKARAEALLAQKNLDKRDMQLAEARLRRALVRSSVAARKDI